MVKGAWKAKIAGFFARAKKAPELSSSVVKRDKLDDGVLSDMLERALLFRNSRFNGGPQIEITDDGHILTEDEHGNQVTATDDDGAPIIVPEEDREKFKGYVAWGDLFDDVFRTLHTYHEPELLPAEEVKPSRELNRRIIQQLTSHDDFQKLRPDTRHSMIESAFTTIAMADNLSNTLTEELIEMVMRANKIDECEQPPGGDGSGGPGGGQPGAGAGSGDGGAPDGGNDPITDEQAQRIADMTADQSQQALGEGIRQAIQNALDEGQEAADALANLPGYGEGGDLRVSPDQMIELAKRYRESPILRNVSKMVGRMQRDMRQARAKRVVGGNEEIVDVTIGNDLAKLLPHELAKLGHPLLKRDFQRRFYEEALLEYETEGTESAGRGPIVICIDGSGSMGGMRNEWSRSVALALITIARKEKRDAAAVEFSDGSSIRKWEFLKRERLDPDKVLDFVTHFFGGGTTIANGMKVAKSFIDTRPEFRKADIVLITDGGDYFNEDRDGVMREELKAKGIRVHGVSIGADANQNAYLQGMCDSTITAQDLAGSNDATKHLAEHIT